MPIDDIALAGTEADGTRSSTYCTYCYREGKFINPNLGLDDMEVIVREQMMKRQMPQHLIDTALTMLPSLERWKQPVTAHQ